MFGKRKTPDETFKEFRSTIRKNTRMIEREQTRLDRQVIDLKNKLKKYVNEHDDDNSMMIAESIVRNKKAKRNFSAMITRLDSLYNNIILMKAKYGVTEALKISGNMLAELNKAISISEINNIIKKFTFENENAEIREEMIDEVMDEAVSEDDINAEIATEMHSVFNEFNIPMSDEIKQRIMTAI